MNLHTMRSLQSYRDYWTQVGDSPFKEEELATIDRLLATEFPLDDETLNTWLDELAGPNGCDFKGDGTWICPGGNDKSQSEKILVSLGVGPDEIALVHDFADVFGGHCSCEIVLNAAERLLPSDDDA